MSEINYFLDHLAAAPFFAILVLLFEVNAFALASPPTKPPLRLNADAAAFNSSVTTGKG